MRSIRETATIIKSQDSPGRFVTSRLLRAARLGPKVAFQANPEVRLRLYPTPVTEVYWMNRSAAYAEDQRFYRQVLSPGDTVVDVGANVGAVTIQAAKLVGPGGRVVAIEAHPRTYRYLLGNIRLNDCPNVTAMNVAVGATRGVIGFSDDTQHDDLNHVVEGGLQVTADTLDHMIGPGPLTLLKVDVEGYERYVLDGAERLLGSTRIAYIESFEEQSQRFGYGTEDLVRSMSARGFTVFRRKAGGWAEVEPGYSSKTVENLVAVSDVELMRGLRS